MKFIKTYPLNEMYDHPPVDETIERFMQKGEAHGISRELSRIAILIYRDIRTDHPVPPIKKDSKLASAILNIAQCYMTLIEDTQDHDEVWEKLLKAAQK